MPQWATLLPLTPLDSVGAQELLFVRVTCVPCTPFDEPAALGCASMRLPCAVAFWLKKDINLPKINLAFRASAGSQ